MATEISPSTTRHEVDRWPRARFAGTGAGVVCINLAVSLIIRPLADVPSTFVPLRPAAVVIVSLLAVVAIGAIRWAAIRWTPRPRSIFTAAVTVGFLVAMVPVIGTETGDADPDLSSPNATATFAVAVLHVIPTLFAIGPVRRHTPRQRSVNAHNVAPRKG